MADVVNLELGVDGASILVLGVKGGPSLLLGVEGGPSLLLGVKGGPSLLLGLAGGPSLLLGVAKERLCLALFGVALPGLWGAANPLPEQTDMNDINV